MRIHITSVLVDDQAKALAFYTEKLGFEKKVDIPVGSDRWLTVVSPEGAEGVELLLEPINNPAAPARDWQKALYEAGIPATSFASDDIANEVGRLKERGVVFTREPTTHGDVTTAVFDDTCGNLIMLVQA